jgi:5'(3')-deoxyribonucleotidase
VALHIADRDPAARAAAVNAKEKWFHARAPFFVRLNAVLCGALQIICATGMVRP